MSLNLESCCKACRGCHSSCGSENRPSKGGSGQGVALGACGVKDNGTEDWPCGTGAATFEALLGTEDWPFGTGAATFEALLVFVCSTNVVTDKQKITVKVCM
ncbi:hypothetical protein ACLOJK_038068 [Asimina triloba]